MKTAVIGESTDGVFTYNASLVSLLTHYDCAPRACQPYRAKTKGKVERFFRYIRQDFFLGRTFRNLDDLNAQFDVWLREIANPRFQRVFSCDGKHQSQPDWSTPPKRVARHESVYASADIHGRADLWNQLLAKVSEDIAQF